MPLAADAETKKLFKTNGLKAERWAAIGIADALLDRSRIYRCAECQARVRPHKESRGQLAHFEHLREFEGCSRSQAFDGTQRSNPRAIE